MPWFYNSHTGTAQNLSGLDALSNYAALHLGVGWHEYATEAQMDAAVQANHWPGPYIGGQGDPTGAAGQLGQEAGGTAGAAAQHAVPAFALDVSGIAGWFFRGLKILFGGVLMIIGVSKLTGTSNAIVRAAGKLPEMAVFA